jgi:hypothetical protein
MRSHSMHCVDALRRRGNHLLGTLRFAQSTTGLMALAVQPGQRQPGNGVFKGQGSRGGQGG